VRLGATDWFSGCLGAIVTGGTVAGSSDACMSKLGRQPCSRRVAT
jgi:hypothetical protein